MTTGDVAQKFGTEAALTITLASLAESASRATGRQSTVVNETSATVTDELLSGKITTAASVTSGEIIEVWVFGQVEDTPTYPGSAGASDAAWTPDTPKSNYLRLAASITIDSTSSKTYWFGPISIAALFGGVLPPRWGVWVTQSTDQNLDSTAGNHAIWHQPVYANVAA